MINLHPFRREDWSVLGCKPQGYKYPKNYLLNGDSWMIWQWTRHALQRAILSLTFPTVSLSILFISWTLTWPLKGPSSEKTPEIELLARLSERTHRHCKFSSTSPKCKFKLLSHLTQFISKTSSNLALRRHWILWREAQDESDLSLRYQWPR